MKTKLLTILTLLVAVCSGAWGASYIPTDVKKISSTQNFVIDDLQKLTSDNTWFKIPSKTMQSKTGVPADDDFETDAKTSYQCLQVKTDGNVFNSGKRCIHMLVTGVTGVKAIGQANSGRGFQIGATEYTSGMSESTTMNIVAGNTSAENPVSYTGLSAKKTYIISILAYSSDTFLYAVRFTAGATDLDDPGLSTTPASTTLSVGGTQQITASATSGGEISYTSSNKSVATVSENGLITAVGIGNATITTTVAATGSYDTDSKITSVIVKPSAPTITKYATFDGTDVSSPEGYFTITETSDGGIQHNTKFAGTYGGHNYTQGLKFQSGTSVNFTTTSVCDLVVVQSLWSTQLIKIDDTSFATNYDTYSYYDDETGNVRVYTVRNLAAGEYTITRNSEFGLLYIGVTEPLTPTISASDVAIAADATEGAIAYTINNGVTGGELTGAEKTTEADWLTIGAISDGSIAFTVTKNTSSESRNATVRLTYTYNTSETTTKDVTVTQTGSVEGSAIIRVALTGVKAADVTGTIGGTASVDVSSTVESGGYKFGTSGKSISLTLAGGNTFKTGDVINVHTTKAADTNPGTLVIFGATADDIVYNTGDKGGLGDNIIVLPAEANGKTTLSVRRTDTYNWNGYVDYIEVTRPNATIKLNASGFATYSSAEDFTVDGADVYKMALTIEGSDVTLAGTKVTDAIPAGEGVLLKGEANATVAITTTTGASALTGNDLKGTTNASDNIVSINTATYDYYALSGDTFMKFTGDAFVANKAYFQTTKGALAAARSFTMTFDDGETTGVSATLMDNGEMTKNKAFFNLNGQRISQPTRGLYIMNGKKVIIK